MEKLNKMKKKFKLSTIAIFTWKSTADKRTYAFWVFVNQQAVSREIVSNVLERELEIDNAREIEIQRVHRIGNKTPGTERQIKACFLKFLKHQQV